MALRLTKTELEAMLKAKIRERARWKLTDSDISASKLGLTADAEQITKVAAEVYDGIISDYTYDDNSVKATRSVRKFNVAYVERVIKNLVNESGFVAEVLMCKLMQGYGIQEAVKEFADKKGKKKKGMPSFLKRKKK